MDRRNRIENMPERRQEVTLEKVEKKEEFEVKSGVEEKLQRRVKRLERKVGKLEEEKQESEEERQRLERVLKFGEIRRKLEEFRQARKELVKAEKSGKDVEEAREKYEKMRVEYVGEKLWRDLTEQERMTEAKAENSKGLFRKFYEWSSNKYLVPKKIVEKINDWQPETKKGKAVKLMANLGLKFTSVRNMASYGLLGAGVAFGATGIGAGAAVGAIVARRALAGVGTGFGTYYTINRLVDWKESKKDIHQELNEQELKGLTQGEIVDRLEYFEAKAQVRGQKINELESYQNYRNLKLELNRRFKERFEKPVEDEKTKSRSGAVKSWLTKNRDQIEDKLSAHYDKEKTKDKRVKLMAIGAGVFTAVGGIRIVGKGIVDMIRGEGTSGFEKAGLQEYNAYKTLFFGKEGSSPEELKAPVKTEELVEKPKVAPAIIPESPEAVPLKKSIVFGETQLEFKPTSAESTTSAVAESTRPKISEVISETSAQPKMPFEVIPPEESPAYYGGGKSIWSEAKNQLGKKFESFRNLNPQVHEAEITYRIDGIKDKILANPEDYGLPKNFDPNKLTAEQIKTINWSKALGGVSEKNVIPKLSSIERSSIIEHNEEIRNWIKGHPGEVLNDEKIDKIISGERYQEPIVNLVKTEESPIKIFTDEHDRHYVLTKEGDFYLNNDVTVKESIDSSGTKKFEFVLGKEKLAMYDFDKDGVLELLDKNNRPFEPTSKGLIEYLQAKGFASEAQTPAAISQVEKVQDYLRNASPMQKLNNALEWKTPATTEQLKDLLTNSAIEAGVKPGEAKLFTLVVSGKGELNYGNIKVHFPSGISNDNLQNQIENFHQLAESKSLPKSDLWTPRYVKYETVLGENKELFLVRKEKSNYELLFHDSIHKINKEDLSHFVENRQSGVPFSEVSFKSIETGERSNFSSQELPRPINVGEMQK